MNVASIRFCQSFLFVFKDKFYFGQFVIMDFDTSFQSMNGHSVVQVLDFDPMEYENYFNQMAQITVIQLQNVEQSEIFVEATDNQHLMMPSDDIGTITSYGSFVRNLNSCETDDYFENMTNSTMKDNFMEGEPDHENMNCRNDCNCERCIRIYFDADTSDFNCFNDASEVSDFESCLYVGNITNVDLMYDFTRVWNEAALAECEEYVEFQRQDTSENNYGNLLLNNRISTQSDREGNVTAEAAGIYDSSASNLLMDL